MEFRDRLYDQRRRAGLSQEELADLLGVTRQAVQKWESGASRPDMDNLTALAGYFHVSLDYLVLGRDPGPGRQDPPAPTVVNNYYSRWRYEYTSKRTLFGLPLVHINVGSGFCRARGIIAVGNLAAGVVAVGGVAVGLFTLGGASLGLLLALGGLALGGVSLGGVAAGILAWGGFAFGLLAVGGMSWGVYAVGGIATGTRLAIGDIASAHVAIGSATHGTVTYTLPLEGGTLASAKGEIASVCGSGTPMWLIRFLQSFLV